MSTDTADPLEQLVRASGEGWLIDSFSPREAAAEHLRRRLADADALARRRFPDGAVRLTEEELIAESLRSPHKVSALLQALGELSAPDLLLAVWRILQGMEILRLGLEYELDDRFRMTIVLRSPYGEPDEQYASDNIDDAAFLRHLGTMNFDGRPVFDGFYAIRRQAT